MELDSFKILKLNILNGSWEIMDAGILNSSSNEEYHIQNSLVPNIEKNKSLEDKFKKLANSFRVMKEKFINKHKGEDNAFNQKK